MSRRKPGANHMKRSVPHWDAELRQLWADGVVVKEFHQPSANQVRILDDLQEQNWTRHNLDPLTPRSNVPLHRRAADSKKRLHEAIRRLNTGQRPTKIRFCGDGTGEGLTWEWVE